MNYIIATDDPYTAQVSAVIAKCFDYFTENRGNFKPNAANVFGIPYHVYEDQWQWQISPTSTTTECLTLLLRACIACNRLDYAQDLADYMINNLFFDTVNVPHWLIDIAGGTEMETVRLGNFHNAVYTFTNGVGIIPDYTPHYGDKISHIRGCFTVETEFPYPDYTIGFVSGQEKSISTFDFIPGGCRITLTDLSFNGNLQVYYSYYNGDVLEENTKYRTYPKNTRCIVDDIFDYQLSIATDGAQWAAVALQELAQATLDLTYSNKAALILAQLETDMKVAESFNRLFDATYRGLVWDSVGTYDESGIRFPFLEPINKHHTRFNFGGDLDKKAVSWAIGKPFNWQSNSYLDITVGGHSSFDLRQFVIKDNNKEYFYPWYENFTGDKLYRITKNEFVSHNNAYLDASRIIYLEPYGVNSDNASFIRDQEDYNGTYKDSNGIYYPLWDKFNYFITRIAYEYCIFGAGTPQGMPGTKDDDLIHLVLAGDVVQNASLFFRVTDSIGQVFRSEPFNINSSPSTYSFRLGDLTPETTGPIQHSVTNVDLLVMVFPEHENPTQNTQGNIYIGAIYLNNRELFNGTQSDFLKFETRQETAGYFDISKAILNEPVNDQYINSGVSTFTLEYTELGLMAWRSGSYVGYTNPRAWVTYQHNYEVALQFIKDAQEEFYAQFGTLGPFMPVYNRNLTENLVYDDLEKWTFNGPDANTPWMGFQYRALVNIADFLYHRALFMDGVKDPTALTILDRWVEFLTSWFKTHPYLPSTVSPSGVIQSTYQAADFNAQVGRAMMLKYIIDNDGKALALARTMLEQLLNMQKPNGAFYPDGSLIYNFHQAEVLLFLGQWMNLFQDLSDIRRAIMVA